MAGGRVHPIPTSPEDGYRYAERARIEPHITEKTRAILLANPGNPTGTVLTPAEDRRALHRIPETGCRLPETAAYLRGALAEMPCTLLAPWEDAVCAYFDLGKDETVAVRSDMDALPVTERTGLPFASAHPGRMHACGHDGHMAMVLGLARRLAAGEVRPQRNVLLIFEPAEETTGGAAPICATGLLERYHVTRVFGMHLWPELPAGVIASRAGAMMSRSCELTVEITGRSVHLARFAEGCDALDAAARLLTRLYALAEGKPCLLRFGKMESGSARNAVSDHTHLEGSLRCLDDGLYAALWEQAQAIGRAVGEETGCTVTMTCSSGYPPVTNDAALLAEVRERFPIAEAETTCITEDFSEYQRHAPGVFFFLGTGGIELHAPTFTFPEEILDKGEALLCGLV